MLAAGLFTAGPAATAHAAGAGGVELTPVSPPHAPAGKRSAFHVDLRGATSATQEFDLRNLGDKPVVAKLYSAAATRQPEGGFSVSGTGTAPWIELPESTVRLQPHEVRRVAFTVSTPELMSEGPTYCAVVMQPGDASSVVVRVATMVYLMPGPKSDAANGLPLRAGVAASLAILAVGVAVAFMTVGRNRDDRRIAYGRRGRVAVEGTAVSEAWRTPASPG